MRQPKKKRCIPHIFRRGFELPLSSSTSLFLSRYTRHIRSNPIDHLPLTVAGARHWTQPNYCSKTTQARKPFSSGLDRVGNTSVWEWNKRPTEQDPYRKTISTYTIVRKPAALKTQKTSCATHKAGLPSPASSLSRLRASLSAEAFCATRYYSSPFALQLV